ncbi:hypothetical protein [Anatilimnocola floriformis]|uniref:hypothetical protein n=1 Tax=Anatilimnocola floriformis TaxID=2948575 RepID=UPI0020C41213|nr:hypothetical protein [Anatilimnocola floriformis]
MADLFSSLPNGPYEEPILAEADPAWPPSPPPPPTNRRGLPDAEQLERAIEGRMACSLAVASWVPALALIVCGPLVIYYHMRIYLLSLTNWFVPLSVLFGVALFFGLLAFLRLFSYGQGTRLGAPLVCVSIAGFLLGLAGGVLVVCALMMPSLLLAKSKLEREQLQREAVAAAGGVAELMPEQKARLAEARDREQLAISKVRKRINKTDSARMARELARNKRQQEETARLNEVTEQRRIALAAQVEEQRRRAEAIKSSDKPGNYRAAMYAQLTAGDKTPLPEYAGPDGERNGNWSLTWNTLDIRPALRPRAPASTESLLDGRFVVNGLEIRRLKLAGEVFVPQAFMYFGSLWLLQTDGQLMEINLADLRPEQDFFLRSRCTNLNLLREPDATRLLAFADDKLIRIGLSRTEGKLEVDATQQKLSFPRQATVFENEFQVVAGSEQPILATWQSSQLTTIRELGRARQGAPSGAFADSQHGKAFPIDRAGSFYVSRPEGIFRGQLAAADLPDAQVNQTPTGPREQATPNRQQAFFSATVSFDDRHVFSGKQRWPMETITWQNVIPAAGIDPEKFAQLSTDRLLTCSAQHNLLVYDRNGKQLLAQTFPGAGKTLGMISLAPLEVVVVFTEKRIFVVSPDPGLVDAKARPGHYPTVALPARPRDDGPELVFKPGPDRRFGDEVFKVTNLPAGTQGIWGAQPDRIFVLDSEGGIHKVSTSTWLVEKSLPLGDKGSDQPYSIDELRWTQAGLVASLPRLHLLAVIDPDTLQVRRTFNFHGWQEGWATHPNSPYVFQAIPLPAQRFDLIDLRDGALVATISADKLQSKERTPFKTSVAFGPRQESFLIGAGKRAYAVKLTPTGFEQINLPDRFFKGSRVEFDVHDDSQQVLMSSGVEVLLSELEGKGIMGLPDVPAGSPVRYGRDGKSIVLNEREYDLTSREMRPIEKELARAVYARDGKSFISNGQTVYIAK